MMSEPFLSDEDVMRFTQGTRRKFVDHLLANGFPNDPKEQYVLLSALGDMDRAALGRMRIGIGEKAVEGDKLVANALVALRAQLQGVDPLQGDSSVVATIPRVRQDLLPPSNAVPGETSVGLEKQTFDEFIDLMENKA